jgi:asparagine synthase (glutamine-hydrolysing)
MAAAAVHRGEASWWTGPGADLAQIGVADGEQRRPQESEAATVLVADARIDDRRSLIAQLAGELRGRDPSEADLIEAAYLRWGPDCAAHLIGDFAFVVWDQRERRLIAARDPMGMRPLYYRFDGQQLMFGSEVKQILALSGVRAIPNETAIATHLAGPIIRPDWSFYQGIDQLAPGHTLVADANGLRNTRHWRPDPDRRVRHRHHEEYASELRSLLADATQDRLRGHRPVGLSLSGGLDSGFVASMVGRSLRDGDSDVPAGIAFSWAFEDLRDADERDVSTVITDHYGLKAIDVPGDEAWPLKAYPEHGPDRDDPEIKVFQVINDRALAAAANEGVGVMFTGDRGDEVIGDWVFDYWGLLRAGRIVSFAADLKAQASQADTSIAIQLRRQLLRPLAEAVVRHPVGGRLTPRSISARVDPSLPSYPEWIPTDFARRAGLSEAIADSLVSDTELRGSRRDRHKRIFSRFGFRNATITERRHAGFGLGYADPWSDRRIAEFILAVPQWVVQTYRQPKALAREAAMSAMPEQARLTARKAIPQSLFDRGFRERGRSVVMDLLTNSIAAEHGFLDASAVLAVYETYLAGRPIHSDFWRPLTLEMWLRDWWQ